MSLLAVTRREVVALAMNPYAYLVAAAYFVISGVFFAALFLSTTLPDLERYYSNIGATLVVLVPLVAVRSFADERRTGVLDLQMSWPLLRWKLVLGKYLANTAFLVVLVSIMWVYVRQLSLLADVEMGKVWAEYLGLVLLVMAFSGVAHAISARASTTPGAAFLGFGILLSLWVMDFVPGWLGETRILGFRLNQLAPTLRLEAPGRGVLSLADVLYFLALTVGGLVLATYAISDNRPRPGIPAARLIRAGASYGVGAVLVAGMAMGAVSSRAQWDLTPTARFTVSQLTETEVVDKLGDQVPKVTAFLERGSAQEVAVRSLIRSFEAVGTDIDDRFVDPDVQPSLAKRFDIQRYGQAIIELDGRTERVESLTEVSLTSALVRLLQPDPQTACFTAGHGERDVQQSRLAGYAQYGTALRTSGFEVLTVALGAEGGQERLDGCDIVILAGPHVRLLTEEFSMLRRFLEDQGRMIVMAPEGEDVRQQVNELIRGYGLAFGEGTVTDTSSLRDDDAAIVAYDYPSQSPATAFVKDHEIPTVFSGASPIGLDPGAAGAGHVSTLVRSSQESGTDAGGAGPLVLAALSDRSAVVGDEDNRSIERTRIAVLGSADVATNEFFGTLGNRDFVTRLTQWVARENDLITAAHAPGGVREVPLTDDQRSELIVRSVVVPGMIPLPLAALVAARRRRR